MFLMTLMVVILQSNKVLAYFDPSTGGLLFNIIWPLVLGFFVGLVGFFRKRLWHPIKSIYSKIFTKN